MARAAVLNDVAAGVAPEPFVDLTHAWPRSPHTEFIWGMFGIGTPPLLAALNCRRTGSLDFAALFAGGRPLAAASCVWADGVAMKLVTRSVAAPATPWSLANFVTMKPWTPRNGTDGFTIAGICMTLNDRPLFLSVSAFHGPVSQKAACPFRKAFFAAASSTFELIRPSLFHLLIRLAFLRNAGFATPMSDGSRLPALFVPKTYPPRPEKNGYMWYASPPVPCWTAMPKALCDFFFCASASVSSCEKVLGAFASFVFTTRPMFSTATGTPYSFLTAVPYEKAFSVYDGKFFVVALLRKIGATRPLAASLPVQSCAAVITSGASAAATVPRLSRMSPKFLVTTLIVAPLEPAQSLATLVTAAARSESVQITIVGPALCAATACVAATAAIAATTPRSAHMRLSEFCIGALLYLGTSGASWGQAPIAAS